VLLMDILLASTQPDKIASIKFRRSKMELENPLPLNPECASPSQRRITPPTPDIAYRCLKFPH
jgi:hypothetical protein